jgi:hypothetical protein
VTDGYTSVSFAAVLHQSREDDPEFSSKRQSLEREHESQVYKLECHWWVLRHYFVGE